MSGIWVNSYGYLKYIHYIGERSGKWVPSGLQNVGLLLHDNLNMNTYNIYTHKLQVSVSFNVSKYFEKKIWKKCEIINVPNYYVFIIQKIKNLKK